MSENAAVARAAGAIGGVTLLSRVLGFIRDMVVASAFGATGVADAFFVAFRLSNMLRELFAEGSMSAAFIPVFTEYLSLRSKEEARELASSVFSLLLIVLLGLTMLGIAFAPQIVGVIGMGYADDPVQFDTTVYLTRVMFPYMLFIGLAAVTMGVLNSTGSFTAPAFSPVMLNVCIIGFALVVSPRMPNPIVGLALGVVVGGLMQLLIQLPPLKKKGMSLYWVFRPVNEGVKRVFRLSIPIVGSLAVTQINVFVGTIIATFLATGSVSYLYYATRLYQFPHGVFGIALATAILPAMSRQAAKGDTASLSDTLGFGVRYIFFISVPAMVGLIVLAVPITSLLFQRGQFGYDATLGTAYALYFYAVGLWAYSGVRIVNSAFYSMKDTKTPVKTALASAALNVVLCLTLMGPLGHGGLALATAIASIFNMSLLVIMFHRRIGKIEFAPVVRSLTKTVAASAFMGALCHLMARNGPWKQDGLVLDKSVTVGLCVLVGAAAYFFAQYLLKSEELSFIYRSYRRRIATDDTGD